MVRPDVARARIGRATARLQDAEGILALQECIDLAAHWVADAGWGVPDDAGSTFDVLADRGVIDRAIADRLREGVGLRNRIAHGYALLD